MVGTIRSQYVHDTGRNKLAKHLLDRLPKVPFHIWKHSMTRSRGIGFFLIGKGLAGSMRMP